MMANYGETEAPLRIFCCFLELLLRVEDLSVTATGVRMNPQASARRKH